ncbi:MAG: FecR domain-containing protein, partial [Oscillospiraceae bacterium]|nr:FecR domain-containing protein [Oscillospiraceae bacterium]
MKKKLLSAIVSFILLFSCILPLNTYANEETGYWERTNIIDSEVDKSKVEKSEYYSPTWVYRRGSYTYRCEVTYDGVPYTGKTHDKCNGEYVKSTGQVATPEKYYLGGEQVVLHTYIWAETSSKICFHLGASVGSFITPINIDDPFASYGTSTSLYDITEKYTKSFLETYKNDTNTGYEGMSADMGAKMPQGSSEGDKVYIVTGLGGGNETMQTAYEYTWHTTGGENAVKMREEYNAKIKEERILEAWKNRQKEKDKLHKLDPNYVDSNLRVADIWGEVWIIRKDKQYEDEWEYLSPNSRIYFGDTIRTHRDSGVVISKTNYTTFSIRENTQITLPDEPESPSATEILSGNIWCNIQKMIHGGEMEFEHKQAVAGIKGTTFAVEEKED